MTLNLALSLSQAYATYHKTQFIQKTRSVLESQERFLQTLLRAHQDTELGQTWGLRDIRTIDQFRAQVPVLPYSAYHPYTERIAKGEANVLNPDPVRYLSLTSGSTGSKKWVPVTHRFQRTLRRADLAGLGFAIERLGDRHLSFGKLLLTNSIQSEGYTPGGIEYGPVSVGSLRQGRLLFEQFFAQPFQALEIADTLARHYVCLLFALRDPQMRGMVANFPMLLLRTCSYLEHYAEELIADIEQGTLADWLQLEPEQRRSLQFRLFPMGDRATQLKKILATIGHLTPQHAWPDLCFIATARGGTSNFYLERFPDYFGDTPVFGGVYGSAEATFGVYSDFNTDSSVLAIASGFFEFIPQDQWDAEHPKTLLPTEVQPGSFYRILTTSYSGFYRYDIGDVVEVTGFYQQAPLIVFRHRRGGLLSAVTEKTTEFHATQTMEKLQQEFNLRLDDFCLTLSDQEIPARYVVNIELAPHQTLADPQKFLHRFEYWLQCFNSRYGVERQGKIPAPSLRILAPGSFAAVRQRQIARGMFDSQLKIPHISEDRYFLAELIVQQEVNLNADMIPAP